MKNMHLNLGAFCDWFSLVTQAQDKDANLCFKEKGHNMSNALNDHQNAFILEPRHMF